MWPKVKGALISAALLGFAVAYGLSPVDLVPDVLIGLGQVDDAVVLAMSGWGVYRQYKQVFGGSGKVAGSEGQDVAPEE